MSDMVQDFIDAVLWGSTEDREEALRSLVAEGYSAFPPDHPTRTTTNDEQ